MQFKNIILKIIIFTLLASICLSIVLTNFSFAAESLTSNIDPNRNATGAFETPLETIIAVIQVIAIGVATIMLVFLGIKYMTSSVSEKAEIKKHAVVYVVGAVIAFGASGILQIFKDFVLKNVK